MVTKCELKELLYVLNFYLLGGVTMGIAAATVVVSFGGTLLARTDFGVYLSGRTITVLTILLIGVITSLLTFIILIPAELKLIRRDLEPKLLAERLTRRTRNSSNRK
jgi:hypothetical protein